MKVKLLSKQAVVIDRKPVDVSASGLDIAIVNPSSNATVAAVRNDRGEEFYFGFNKFSVHLPETVLTEGDIIVRFLTAEGETWVCENLISENIGGVHLVRPDDGDLANRIVELEQRCEEYGTKIISINSKLLAMDKKLTSLVEGYDVV